MNMKVRRMLTAIAVCLLASFALVATTAQAAPSAAGGGGGSSATPMMKKSGLPKIKGAKVYYYCGTTEGCPAAYDFVVYPKTKSWEFYNDPGYGGVFEKVKKSKDVFFYYEDGFNEECLLLAEQVKGGYADGGFYCDFGEGYELYEEWDAFKKLV